MKVQEMINLLSRIENKEQEIIVSIYELNEVMPFMLRTIEIPQRGFFLEQNGKVKLPIELGRNKKGKFTIEVKQIPTEPHAPKN